MEHLPVIIFGTSGSAKEIYLCIKQCNMNPQINHQIFDVMGFISEEESKIGSSFIDNHRIVASDSTLKEFLKGREKVGAFLPFGFPAVKQKVYHVIKNIQNIVFPPMLHPSVVYDPDTTYIGSGTIIAAGSIISADCMIGDFNYISTGGILGHDLKLGNFNVLNPRATISGNVTIGDGCLIGAGSTVLQGLSLDNGVTIGAGALLTKNAKQGKTYIGVPAIEMKGR
jgi:sugar O-acyltransferase (sialic acid O-acetyltransferase NeuD family)